jgi:cyclopropane-fatty-acyl-phospholipid synthase
MDAGGIARFLLCRVADGTVVDRTNRSECDACHHEVSVLLGLTDECHSSDRQSRVILMPHHSILRTPVTVFKEFTNMIYKFKSQAAGDVIMMKSNGDQMLTIIGKEAAPQGIITVAQIPAAIAALEAAVATHEATLLLRAGNPPQDVEIEGDSVMLRQRAAPFIELLKCSAAAGKDVVWGV